MDYSKLDAALSSELARDTGAQFRVFVRFAWPLTPEAALALRAYGLPDAEGERMVNASLPARIIDALSDIPWVTSIRLSESRRLL